MSLALWLWLASSPAELSEAAAVRWQAPVECPSETQFLERVDELRAGGRLSSSFAFEVVGTGPFELRVEGHAQRYAAVDCEALVDTALLLVSLAIVEQPEPVEQTSDHSLSPGERGREAADVAPHLRASRRSRRSLPSLALDTAGRLRVESGVSVGITPSPAWELHVGAGPRGELWAVDLGLLARPSFAGTTSDPEASARLSTWGALARVCVGGQAWQLTLAGCAGLELALVSARATGSVIDPRVGRRPWLVVEVGPDFAVPISRRVALVSRVSGTWLAVRPAFSIADAGSVCCRDLFGISVRLGVQIGLGPAR